MKCYISYFFVLFVGDFVAESGSRQSAEKSFIVPKYKKNRGALRRKGVSDELRSGMSYRAAGFEFNVNDQYVGNKEKKVKSLSRVRLFATP